MSQQNEKLSCSHDIGTGVLCGYPELHPVHQVRTAQGYHSFEGQSNIPVGFVEALAVAQRVFDEYKRDYLKWWKRMDGTPIINDIAVRMAMAFSRHVLAVKILEVLMYVGDTRAGLSVLKEAEDLYRKARKEI